jgi:CRP-like cAMP-binding protein
MIQENPNTNELYSMLSPELCQELRKHEHSMKAPLGTTLIQHGVFPKGLVILDSGKVRISVPSARRSTSVDNGEPGKVYGMRAAISGELPEIDVTCLEDCQVTFLPRDVFIDVLQTHPEIYFAVAKVLSADLEIANRILRCSFYRSSTPRVKVPRPV